MSTHVLCISLNVVAAQSFAQLLHASNDKATFLLLVFVCGFQLSSSHNLYLYRVSIFSGACCQHGFLTDVATEKEHQVLHRDKQSFRLSALLQERDLLASVLSKNPCLDWMEVTSR